MVNVPGLQAGDQATVSEVGPDLGGITVEPLRRANSRLRVVPGSGVRSQAGEELLLLLEQQLLLLELLLLLLGLLVLLVTDLQE